MEFSSKKDEKKKPLLVIKRLLKIKKVLALVSHFAWKFKLYSFKGKSLHDKITNILDTYFLRKRQNDYSIILNSNQQMVHLMKLKKWYHYYTEFMTKRIFYILFKENRRIWIIHMIALVHLFLLELSLFVFSKIIFRQKIFKMRDHFLLFCFVTRIWISFLPSTDFIMTLSSVFWTNKLVCE